MHSDNHISCCPIDIRKTSCLCSPLQIHLRVLGSWFDWARYMSRHVPVGLTAPLEQPFAGSYKLHPVATGSKLYVAATSCGSHKIVGNL